MNYIPPDAYYNVGPSAEIRALGELVMACEVGCLRLKVLVYPDINAYGIEITDPVKVLADVSVHGNSLASVIKEAQREIDVAVAAANDRGELFSRNMKLPLQRKVVKV